jgi:outer membrane protein assembly factor BamB
MTIILTLIFGLISGFDRPESIIRHANYIYVSNINGLPLQKNGKGYISKLDLQGRVIKKKFIVGLNAPKGLAACGRILYVTDIDVIYAFNIFTGRKIRSWKVRGAKFLNDIGLSGDGILYISDMNDSKIYRIKNGVLSIFTTKIKNPNGVAVDFRGIIFINQVKGGKVFAMKPTGGRAFEVVKGGIDGGDGIGFDRYYRYLYVSSITKGEIYKIEITTGKFKVIYKGLTSPADISVDVEYNRILVPLMHKNAVRALNLQ